MHLMCSDIFKQYVDKFRQYVFNILSIFGHVLGNWAQGLAWGGDLVCHADWTPPGYYYGMQSNLIT